jgi:hypothetical protein
VQQRLLLAEDVEAASSARGGIGRSPRETFGLGSDEAPAASAACP